MLYTLGIHSALLIDLENVSMALLELIYIVCAIGKQYIVFLQFDYIILDSFYKVTFKKNATIEIKYAMIILTCRFCSLIWYPSFLLQICSFLSKLC